METTEDLFLGGRLKIRQPKIGYRAGADPVFLAAAVDAKAGDTVLDLGCGVGVAMLCLKARCPNVEVTGIDVQSSLVNLALQNLGTNGFQGNVIAADACRLPTELSVNSFDHVITNPPFFETSKGSPSQDASRDAGRRSAISMETWLDIALRRIKPGGSLTLVNRIDHLPECLAALMGRAGAVQILPLAARSGRAAKLFLLSAKKGAKAPMCLLAPLILHEGAEHTQDGDSYTRIAASVLRDGQALRL